MRQMRGSSAGLQGPASRSRGRSHALTLAGVVVAALLGAAVFLLYPRPAGPPHEAVPEVEPMPEALPAPDAKPPASAAPAPVAQPEPPLAAGPDRAESAREIIARLRGGSGEPDYAQAFGRGRELHAAGQLADAQLLYFFAARGGHAEAALALAESYDPVRFTPQSSLMDEPDPFQAYKWYRQAAAGGDARAGERLDALRAWAEQAAANGDPQAQRLLLAWKEASP